MTGLHDAASPTGDGGSTAEIARWLAAPVVRVYDASGVARSIAAIARGFAAFDPTVRPAARAYEREARLLRGAQSGACS